MPPVNQVASSTDVDNEATAELPVLDVAAYESALEDPVSNTDTFRAPPAAEGTVQMPALNTEAIPTLRAAEAVAACDLDHSATHEMPAFAPPNKVLKATPAGLPSPVAPPARTTATAAPITLPPSPPLIEELRKALAAAERRVEELNEKVRIADAERMVAIARVNSENMQLREQLGLHLESLHTAKERLGVQSADQSAIDDELFARADRITALERELATQGRLLQEKNAALGVSVQLCATLGSDAANLRAAAARRDAQIAVLEADLVSRQQHETSMQQRLNDAQAAMDPHVPQLRTEIVEHEQQILTLKETLAATQIFAAEKDADLQVAEESIRNLEIEVRDKTSKLAEANVTVEEWRAVIAESQRSILQRDSRIQQLETDLEKRIAPAPAAIDSAGQTGEEVALEGPARVLIRTDGNTEFLHVLGRRTRIGRGSDNELVLDTKHISRYHAVLLAGPVHTSIEDLNSTNGVFVNGKRVARQVLKDGDRVTIGRTQFRYTVRT